MTLFLHLEEHLSLKILLMQMIVVVWFFLALQEEVQIILQA